MLQRQQCVREGERKPCVDLLFVYFGSIDVPFLDGGGWVGLPCLVVIKHHLPHQHHQLMQVMPSLQHKVTRVACHWYEHIYILTRLKEEDKENDFLVLQLFLGLE